MSLSPQQQHAIAVSLGSECTILASGIAKLHLASPDPQAVSYVTEESILFQYPQLSNSTWTDAEVTGALVLVADNSQKTLLFQIHSLLQDATILFEYELYDNIDYLEMMPNFHAFEMEECVAGFAFADTTVAKKFMQKVMEKKPTAAVVTNQRQASYVPVPPKDSKMKGDLLASKKNSNNNHNNENKHGRKGTKHSKKKGKKDNGISLDDIGEVERVEHRGHIGIRDGQFDVKNLPAEWVALFKQVGIKKKDLEDKDTRTKIFQTIQSAEMDMYYKQPVPNNAPQKQTNIVNNDYTPEQRLEFERYQHNLQKFRESANMAPPAVPPRKPKDSKVERNIPNGNGNISVNNDIGLPAPPPRQRLISVEEANQSDFSFLSREGNRSKKTKANNNGRTPDEILQSTSARQTKQKKEINFSEMDALMAPSLASKRNIEPSMKKKKTPPALPQSPKQKAPELPPLPAKPSIEEVPIKAVNEPRAEEKAKIVEVPIKAVSEPKVEERIKIVEVPKIEERIKIVEVPKVVKEVVTVFQGHSEEEFLEMKKQLEQMKLEADRFKALHGEAQVKMEDVQRKHAEELEREKQRAEESEAQRLKAEEEMQKLALAKSDLEKAKANLEQQKAASEKEKKEALVKFMEAQNAVRESEKKVEETQMQIESEKQRYEFELAKERLRAEQLELAKLAAEDEREKLSQANADLANAKAGLEKAKAATEKERKEAMEKFMEAQRAVRETQKKVEETQIQLEKAEAVAKKLPPAPPTLPIVPSLPPLIPNKAPDLPPAPPMPPPPTRETLMPSEPEKPKLPMLNSMLLAGIKSGVNLAPVKKAPKKNAPAPPGLPTAGKPMNLMQEMSMKLNGKATAAAAVPNVFNRFKPPATANNAMMSKLQEKMAEIRQVKAGNEDDEDSDWEQ